MIALQEPSAVEILETRFGLSEFRQGQQEVIDRLLAGRSTLAIFPTGAGKSLCYQLPALMMDGLTLVVSPLIALMKDQIDALSARDIPAARLDSTIDSATAVATYRAIHQGTLKLLYVAPERLANERFLQTVSRMKVAMLAVDEAHCISEWGHNFRPDYLKLAALAKRLNVGRVLALTATATPPVAQQISAAFEIAPDDIVRTGFYRPNLAIAVTPIDTSRRDQHLLDQLRRRPRGPTIVYVTLQKTAEDVAANLSKAGFDASAYHAGLETEVRHRVQEYFMGSQDAIVVATIAFGMGIDKRDIRYVYHYNLPKSLENYAQEIGRAGRDGRNSVCEIMACEDDRIVLENFVFGDTPEPRAVATMLSEILAAGRAFDVSVHDLSVRYDIRPLVVETLLTYLQLDGVIDSTGPFYTQYKLRWLNSAHQVLSKLDHERARFVKQLLNLARQGKTWLTLDIAHATQQTGEPRQRIVAALTYLDEQGDLEIEAAGVRQGFRRTALKVDPAALLKTMSDRFARREDRDIQRLEGILEFCRHDGCHTRKLLDYFGESLKKPCGHCAHCRGARPAPLKSVQRTAPTREIAAAGQRVLAMKNKVLAGPRQVARFLCGIPSPGVSRSRGGKSAQFGAFAHVPFAQVIEALKAVGPRTGASF